MPAATHLNSWKEIAAYLGCDVSTAQRWERERALPVRRIPGGKRQTVFAVPEELNQWLVSSAVEEADVPPQIQPALPRKLQTWILVPTIAVFAMLLIAFVSRSWRQPPRINPVPQYPRITVAGSYLLVTGDLNEDGIPDIATSVMPGRTVSVVLSDGRGGAVSVQGYDTCTDPRMLAIADFDADGHPDLAVGCTEKRVIVFWGDGTGLLKGSADVVMPDVTPFIGAADLDQDGKADLVCLTPTEIYVLLSRGRKFFVADHHTISAVSLTDNVGFGDLNGDGLIDPIVTVGLEGNGKTLLRFLNRGGGKLRPLEPLFTPGGIGPFVVADLNHDGRVDIAVATYDAVQILLGSGDGELRSFGQVPQDGHGGMVLAAADFNGDNNLDLAICGHSEGTLMIAYGRGNGEFVPGSRFEFAFQTLGVAAADFNRDGHPDVAVSIPFERVISVRLGPFR